MSLHSAIGQQQASSSSLSTGKMQCLRAAVPRLRGSHALFRGSFKQQRMFALRAAESAAGLAVAEPDASSSQSSKVEQR